jgi:SAM-dependent methyltransferase
MPDTYDSVPYTSYAYAFTHPDSLCALGRLFGLSPAPPTRCRVLELGCASGGNLMPMAELLPECEFVGIDRSRVQIDQGRALLGELGLANVRLEQADIMRVDPQTIGSFDYVICHGVFAWVPREVQDRILALTAAVLRPRGLAFVSYNVYPGWHMRETVRRMMLFHRRRFDDPVEAIKQTRALVDFLATTVERRAGADDPYAKLLGRELEIIRRASDPYIFHEYLERDNSPLYFHEFIARLHAVPLRYLCDTDVNLMVSRDMDDQTRAVLGRIADDQVTMEQYLDFVRNRQFRTSVLCRIEAAPQRRLQPEQAESLRYAMAAEPTVDSPSLEPGVELAFACSSKARINSPEAATKAALLELCERWPASVDFDTLIDAARERLHAAGLDIEPDRRSLAADLIECVLRKAVIVRCWEPPVASSVPDKPRVSPFNRVVAVREGWIATLHHHRHQLSAPMQQIVPLLDGTRDRAALLAEALRLVEAGALAIRNQDDEPVPPGPELEQAAAGFLDEELAKLVRLAALERSI